MSDNEDEERATTVSANAAATAVINPNLTQDDVLSLSAVYGLTLNKKQRHQLKGVQQHPPGSGSTPDLR